MVKSITTESTACEEMTAGTVTQRLLEESLKKKHLKMEL